MMKCSISADLQPLMLIYSFSSILFILSFSHMENDPSTTINVDGRLELCEKNCCEVHESCVKLEECVIIEFINQMCFIMLYFVGTWRSFSVKTGRQSFYFCSSASSLKGFGFGLCPSNGSEKCVSLRMNIVVSFIIVLVIYCKVYQFIFNITISSGRRIFALRP